MSIESPDFHTRDFSFEEGTLFLFRRRYIHKKIRYGEIHGVTLKLGSYLKRPALSLIFGISLLSINAWIFASAGFHLVEFFNTGLFFIAAIGIYLIYSAVPIHPVIEIRFDNQTECFSISIFMKRPTVKLFIDFLKTELGSEKVAVRSLSNLKENEFADI